MGCRHQHNPQVGPQWRLSAHPLRERRLSARARTTRHRREHEPQGRLLGQRRRREFFATIKAGLIAYTGYATYDAAIASIADCSERFRNPQRRHSHLDCISPIEFELKAQVAAPAAWSSCPPTRGRIKPLHGSEPDTHIRRDVRAAVVGRVPLPPVHLAASQCPRTPPRDIDFSRAIQPHRYAKLRTGYGYTVFLEPDLWQHCGSPEAVKAAFRDLVAASRHVRAPG